MGTQASYIWKPFLCIWVKSVAGKACLTWWVWCNPCVTQLKLQIMNWLSIREHSTIIYLNYVILMGGCKYRFWIIIIIIFILFLIFGGGGSD